MAISQNEISGARVLITVKTYPLPSSGHGEVVCTAGLLNGERWVRLYPISQRAYDDRIFPKYSWVEIDLKKHPSDSRPESYMPTRGLDEPMRLLERLGTGDNWAARKDYVLRETFSSMSEVLELYRTADKSLATLKPREIIDFAWDTSDREWSPAWKAKLNQLRMFEAQGRGQQNEKKIIRKVPYTFKYRFLSDGDQRPRELSIHDWEIGSLYWKAWQKAEGDEKEAISLVRQKYFHEFVEKKDLHLFLGTTYSFHKRRVPDPFVIVGVFYPPKTTQLSLFRTGK